ncbi:hypothetical protein GGF32_007866, partial [Allomyces javanicus]
MTRLLPTDDVEVPSVSLIGDVKFDLGALAGAMTVEEIRKAIPTTIELTPNFSARFSKHVAAFKAAHPDLNVDKVLIVVIFGPQKSGKSTLLNALF